MEISTAANLGLAPEDMNSILESSRDYIESWYTGDAERMRRCLHPELAKRTVLYDPQQRKWTVRHTSAQRMVDLTHAGEGTHLPEGDKTHQITVLNAFGRAACAKVISYEYVDYVQLAKFDQRWLIVNVPWFPRREEG